MELGTFARSALAGGKEGIGLVGLAIVAEVGVVDGAEVGGRCYLLPVVVPVVGIVLAEGVGHLFGHHVAAVCTLCRHSFPAYGRLGVGGLVTLYDDGSNGDVEAYPDGRVSRSTLSGGVEADDGVSSLAILWGLIFVGDGLAGLAFEGGDYLAIATYFYRSDVVEGSTLEGGGRQGEGQSAVECTAFAWRSAEIRRGCRAFEIGVNSDADIVNRIVGAELGCAVVEGDVVESVFLNVEVDDLARVIVSPVEVVLGECGLEGIYGGALSEQDVHVLMSQANFICIEGETILYVLLKLDGRSDEVVIHSFATIGVEVWIVSTIAKEVSALIS